MNVSLITCVCIHKKSGIFKCYSSKNLIALITPFTRLPSSGAHFTAELTEAMWIKCLAQGNNILMAVFEPSTSVSRNRHSNHTNNMPHAYNNNNNGYF